MIVQRPAFRSIQAGRLAPFSRAHHVPRAYRETGIHLSERIRDKIIV
jgi:hypothetical protein